MSNFYDIFSVKGKKVLITGAANGNGEAISKAFGDAKSELCLVDIDGRNLEIVANNIEKKTNITVDRFVVDFTNGEELESFLECNSDFDIVINNAGITKGGGMLDYDISDWDATYKVNLLAPYRIMQKVARSMVHKKSGSIINITSLASEFGFPGNPAYVAFKGALKQLTKAAACDLASYGIRVNSIGPGYIRTNMTNQSWNNESLKQERTDRTMLGRWGESKDLIGAVIFLSSDAESYITGQDLYVDGGWTAKGL